MSTSCSTPCQASVLQMEDSLLNEHQQLTVLVCTFPVQNRLVMRVNLSQCTLNDF